MHLTDDVGSKEALQFLMTREITHMKAFTAALDSLGTGRFLIGWLPPTSGVVDEYYNDSTGDGANGAPQWLKKNGLHVVKSPFSFEGRNSGLSVDGEKTGKTAAPAQRERKTA